MKKCNNILGAIVACIVILVCLVSCGSTSSTSPNNQAPFKIGALLPLTGDNASYGIDCRKGMELALNKYNAKHNSHIMMLVEDSKAEPQTAVSAVSKLISINKINVILGGMFSTTTLAVAPIAQRNGIVLLTPTASLKTIVQAGDHIFSIYPSDQYEGKLDARIALKAGAGRVGIFQQQIQVFSTMGKSFQNTVDGAGKKVAFYEVFPSGIRNFRTLIEKHKDDKIDAIYIAAYKNEAFNLIEQLKEEGMGAKIFSQSTLYDPQTISVLGKAANGIVLSAPFYNEQASNSLIKHFRQAYFNQYKKMPNIWAAYGYDAVMLILEAHAKGLRSNTPLYQVLAKIKFDGVTGPMTFNPNRTANKTMQLFKISDGSFVSIGQ